MIKHLLYVSLLLLMVNSCKETPTQRRQFAPKQKRQPDTKKSSIKNPTFPTKAILGTWTTDGNGPHADFELTKNSFYIVDFDGDGDRRYAIIENKIYIYHPENRIQTGLIKKAQNDSLIIYWSSGDYATYVRWRN